MESLADLLLWRFGLAWGGLAAFLAWESLRPFRRSALGRLPHYATNVALALLNVAVLRLLFGMLLFEFADESARRGLGLLHRLGAPPLTNVVGSVVLLDLFTFGMHRLYHSVPALWRLHLVHHSDDELDVTTAVRFHTLEVVISAAARAVFIVAIGAGIAAVLIFEIALLAASQFQHGNFRVGDRADRWLRAVIVTPDMHRIHHSDEPSQTNSNFATIFSWWDRLLGTFRLDVRPEAVRVGLRDHPSGGAASLRELLRMPFAARGMGSSAPGATGALSPVTGSKR